MLKKLWNRILFSAPVRAMIRIADSIRPWGFEGLSLFYVMRFFVEGLQKGAVTTRAAAISFRLFLAVFPALILLLSIIPLVPIDDFQESLFSNIQGFFPGDTFDLVETTLDDLINRKHNTLLSIGFLLVLFYSSSSVNAILTGFSGSYNVEHKGNPVVFRLLSLLLMLVLTIFILMAVVLIIFSGMVFDYLKEFNFIPDDGIILLLNIARWLITLFLIYMSISTLYNVGDYKGRRWKTFSAGASFATLFFIIASLGFAWFVNNFAQYNTLYGSLGTLLLLLIWINFNCNILLLGFELNASIGRAKSEFETRLTTMS
ncbi:MAG: YihY/virulence factor BrkB family protein [Flavobacteriales bacterium]|nr:YihY/virulence factor BrkB family protein [Flavobacteriales bacterium]